MINDSSIWIVKWKNVARYLKVSVRTAKNYHYCHGLRVIKGGKGSPVRVLKSELDRFYNHYNKN